MSRNSYIHVGAECRNTPDEGGGGRLVSDDAKGNKDIQKGMQGKQGTKSKAK